MSSHLLLDSRSTVQCTLQCFWQLRCVTSYSMHMCQVIVFVQDIFYATWSNTLNWVRCFVQFWLCKWNFSTNFMNVRYNSVEQLTPVDFGVMVKLMEKFHDKLWNNIYDVTRSLVSVCDLMTANCLFQMKKWLL
jgi:hypothetical protein